MPQGFFLRRRVAAAPLGFFPRRLLRPYGPLQLIAAFSIFLQAPPQFFCIAPQDKQLLLAVRIRRSYLFQLSRSLTGLLFRLAEQGLRQGQAFPGRSQLRRLLSRQFLQLQAALSSVFLLFLPVPFFPIQLRSSFLQRFLALDESFAAAFHAVQFGMDLPGFAVEAPHRLPFPLHGGHQGTALFFGFGQRLYDVLPFRQHGQAVVFRLFQQPFAVAQFLQGQRPFVGYALCV